MEGTVGLKGFHSGCFTLLSLSHRPRQPMQGQSTPRTFHAAHCRNFFAWPWAYQGQTKASIHPEAIHRTHTNLRSSVMGMKWYSAWEARSGASVCLQGSAESLRPGLVNFVIAVAYHFFPSLPAAFTQPGLSLLADPCIFLDLLISFLPCQGCGCNKPSVWENPFSGYHRILKESTNVNMP